jgi:Cd2+/Zn2+-exporting ATPase
VDLAPQTAVLSEGGRRVRVEDVKVGSLLAVKAGEIIPIDGEVVSGKSSVDESSVTGESMPVEKEVGATVWAGTLNMSGFMTVSTTALSEDSAVSRMVRLVEEAQNQRSSTEMLVEKIAKYYTPAIVLAALAIGVIPWAAGVHNHRHWIYLALVLLIVACPCALVISTPVVVTCGIAQAARLGLLIKGGSYLEVLGKLKVVALDKTGTLSEGQFRVLDIVSVDANCSVQQILYWYASLLYVVKVMV